MPLFDYKCKKCKKEFSELVKNYQEKVICPDCGSETERLYSGKIYSPNSNTSHCTGNCKTCKGCK